MHLKRFLSRKHLGSINKSQQCLCREAKHEDLFLVPELRICGVKVARLSRADFLFLFFGQHWSRSCSPKTSF